jgi:hypothetical protein
MQSKSPFYSAGQQGFYHSVVSHPVSIYIYIIHTKKSFSIFPSPAGMSLTKLSLGGNNLYMTSLFPPKESLVSDIPAGDGNIEKLVLRYAPLQYVKGGERSWRV